MNTPSLVQPSDLVHQVATQYGLSIGFGLLVGLVFCLLASMRP